MIPQCYPLYAITIEYVSHDREHFLHDTHLIVGWVEASIEVGEHHMVPVLAGMDHMITAYTWSGEDGSGISYHLFHTVKEADAARQVLARQYDDLDKRARARLAAT